MNDYCFTVFIDKYTMEDSIYCIESTSLMNAAYEVIMQHMLGSPLHNKVSKMEPEDFKELYDTFQKEEDPETVMLDHGVCVCVCP